MADEPLAAIYDRLMRAKEHLEDVKGELIAYYGSDFSALGGEFDPGGHERPASFIIRGRSKWPSTRFHTIVGEMLHDLRSALDHLAWQLVVADGNTPVERLTTFPILKSVPAEGRPEVAGGVSEEALALIDEAQPYKLGEYYAAHPLWMLHQLWNIDKHRHIATRGGRLDGFLIPAGTQAFTYAVNTLSYSEYGAEVQLVPDIGVDVDVKSTIRIMVHEPEPGIDRPLFEVLAEALTAVATTVTSCEDACF